MNKKMDVKRYHLGLIMLGGSESGDGRGLFPVSVHSLRLM